MAKYVDGFVLPVPKNKLAKYRKMAEVGKKVWIEHGALEYFECVGEELDVKFGLPFPRGIKSRKGETIVFSWIVYKSKAHRNRVSTKVMSDSRLKLDQPMPFDVKRMLFGGFEVMVEGK